MANYIITSSNLNPEAPSFTPQNLSATSFYLNIVHPQYHRHHDDHLFFPPMVPVPTVLIPNIHHDEYQTVVMQNQQSNQPIVRSGSPSNIVGVGQYLGQRTRTRSNGRQNNMRARGNYHNAINVNGNYANHGGATRVSREKNDNINAGFHQSAPSNRPRKMSSVRKPSGSSMPSSSSTSTTRVKFNDDHNVITTLMIRNIPSRYTRQMLMEFLDGHCMLQNQTVVTGDDHDQSHPLRSAYDFLYLPIDFRSKFNKGYAFVNFTSAEGASNFEKLTSNKRWPHFRSSKTREIAIATIQGKKNLVKHFETMKFRCEDEEFLPVWFVPARNGTNNNSVNIHTVGKLIGYA